VLHFSDVRGGAGCRVGQSGWIWSHWLVGTILFRSKIDKCVPKNRATTWKKSGKPSGAESGGGDTVLEDIGRWQKQFHFLCYVRRGFHAKIATNDLTCHKQKANTASTCKWLEYQRAGGFEHIRASGSKINDTWHLPTYHQYLPTYHQCILKYH